MGNLFVFIYNFFEKRRVLLFLLSFLGLSLSGFLASRLTIEEDISKALPSVAGRAGELLRNGKFLDKIVITVSLADSTAEADPERLLRYTESFAAEADSVLKPYIAHLQYKTDDDAVIRLLDYMHNNLPVFLEAADYAHIDSLIQPDRVKALLEQDLRTLSSPAGISLKSMIARDPLGLSWIGMRKVQAFQFDEQYELYDGYIMTRDGRNLLMFLQPSADVTETKNNQHLINGLDALIDRLSAGEFADISTTYFGSTPVSVSNAVQMRADTALTLSITVVLLLLVTWWFFRRKWVPILLLLPVFAGLLFSLAAIYLIQGSISMIAVGTGSVVFGIALNYSIHFFAHSRYIADVRQNLRELAEPMTLGSATTVGAFLCLQFVNSEILRDLGLFAALSLLGTAMFTLIVLPHLISAQKEATGVINPSTTIDRLSNLRPERNKYLVAFILLFTPVLFYFALQIRFDDKLENLNFMPERLKQAQEKLNRLNTFAQQSIYTVSEGTTLEEALRNAERLTPEMDRMKQEGLLRKYSSVSVLLLSDSLQNARIARWNAYWTAEKKAQLHATLAREGAQIKFKASAFEPFKAWLGSDFHPTSDESVDFIKKQMLSDYLDERPDHVRVVTLMKAMPGSRENVYARLSKAEGTFTFDKQYITNQFVGVVQADFNNIALYSSLLVFLALLLAYGRIELAVITFLPMAVSWIWILGLMRLLGVEFNIVNVILSALIFGLGDDFSIFVMDSLQHQYRSGRKVLPVVRSAIFMSALTTIIGLGVLFFAKHPAVHSLAVVSVVGIVCVVFVSQTLEPFFFNLLIGDRVAAKRPPYTFFKIAKAAVAFGYFVLGSILLTGVGLVFVRGLPFAKKKIKYLYHKILSKFTGSLIYLMANVKKRIINPEAEQFDRPAIVVCNHQSMLDILSITMLHPKLLLLTNKWVWESPVFGKAVQMADYFPVGEGYDNVDKMEDQVRDGYSIVVFPEGTRSTDGSVKRFHKGAFYMAEKFNIDILPIVIHGTAYCMSKGDFMLKDGQITLKFLPRISPNDTRFGNGYVERTKSIGRYFRQEHEQLRAEIEKPAYFREQLIANYLYKGPVLEWYARVKTALEGNYALFDELLPKKGKIVDIGCGYGFMSYMLRFLSKDREITGIDYDEDKITVANHCYSRDEQIRFEHVDILTYQIGPADGFILADVLHYLQPAEQKYVLEKCLSQLNPGGVMIIRDGNKEMKERHKGTWLTEFFSTRVLGFNKTKAEGLSFLAASDVTAVVEAHGLHCEIIDRSKRTSNIIFVIRNQNNNEPI